MTDSSNGHSDHHDHEASGDASGTEAFADIRRNLSELLDYALQYVGATFGGVFYTFKKFLFLAVLGLVAAIVALTVLITGSVLVALGLAGAISAVMPSGWQWVGPLAVGLLITVGSLLGLFLLIRMLATSGKRSAAESYRRSLIRQRQRHGTDAIARAKHAAAESPKHPTPRDLKQEADALRN